MILFTYLHTYSSSLSQELQAKNEAANAKLRQMVKDQQEAEKKKVQSQEIQQQLAIQTVAINQKRDDVMADLAQVEPAVIDAQNGMYLSEKFFLHNYRNIWMFIFKADQVIIKLSENDLICIYIIMLTDILYILCLIGVFLRKLIILSKIISTNFKIVEKQRYTYVIVFRITSASKLQYNCVLRVSVCL